MLWRTHALAGVASLWVVQAIPNSLVGTNLGVMAVLAALGALLPDLDAEQSKVKTLTVGGIQPFAPVSVVVHRTYGHRGMLHSAAGLTIVGMIAIPFAIWFGWQPSLALWLGYASHLILDACTRSGVPLWPTRERRIYLLPSYLRFVTGSMAEEVLIPLFGMAALVLFLYSLPFASNL